MTAKTPAHLLLQVRALHERMAQRRTAEAVAARTREEEHARALQTRLAALALPESAGTEEFSSAVASRRALAGLVVAQWESAAAAAAEVDLARAQWLVAERDRESMDRVVAQLRAEQDERRARLEQREADDLAGSRHDRATRTHDRSDS
jgi:hypothetical protein